MYKRQRQHRVGAGLIQSHRIEGGKHTHVGGDGHIVLPVAVTVGGDVHDQRDMEAGTALHHSLGVLGDLPVQNGRSLVIPGSTGVLGADGQAAGAAHALIRIDGGLAVLAELGRAMGTDLGAGPAADALLLLDKGLAGVVHLHLAGPGAAAHADILQAAAHTGLLMALSLIHI